MQTTNLLSYLWIGLPFPGRFHIMKDLYPVIFHVDMKLSFFSDQSRTNKINLIERLYAGSDDMVQGHEDIDAYLTSKESFLYENLLEQMSKEEEDI